MHVAYSGATTGTGGRIRDVQAVGRGGHCIAGTAGYSVGNLYIPGMSNSCVNLISQCMKNKYCHRGTVYFNIMLFL